MNAGEVWQILEFTKQSEEGKTFVTWSSTWDSKLENVKCIYMYALNNETM